PHRVAASARDGKSEPAPGPRSGGTCATSGSPRAPSRLFAECVGAFGSQHSNNTRGGEHVANYSDILYDTDGPVATITLNRPEKMNALSNNLRGEMVHALKEGEFDPSIHVIVIRGAGRTFSAGYDIGGGMEAGEHSPFVHPRSRRPDVGSTR